MSGWISIILSGGESRRMGMPKALLSVGGETVLERLVRVVQPISKHIIVVGREEEEHEIRKCLPNIPNLVLIRDDPRFKGKGPLAGMHAGMVYLPADYYFVCACDMPCLDVGYLTGLKSLVEEKKGYRAYIPMDNDKFQPFAAVYKGISAEIEALLSQNQYKWIALLPKLHCYYVIDKTEWGRWTERPNPFFNMNTPEDYRRIRSGCV
jgi:molybdopterin-guanine dinucleotide biosynthesis protein A